MLGAAVPTAWARAPLSGYLAKPTEQLALPGSRASGEITPDGDVYTGWAEYGLAVGNGLQPWAQPTRILPRPYVPLFLSRLTRGGISYTQQVFTIPIDGQPVTYLSLSAHNDTGRRLTAQAALQVEYSRGREVTGFHGVPTGAYRYERPATTPADGFFFQLGATFDPRWQYSVAGRDVLRDGLLLVRGPRGGRSLSTPDSDSPVAAHAKEGYFRSLPAGADIRWTWQIPLEPPEDTSAVARAVDAVSFSAALARLVDFWRRQERGMTQIDVPETRVDDIYAANAVEILQSRYQTASGWVQGVNRLQYQSYWIRDSSVDTVALDDIGLHADAAQNLAFLPRWQQPDGLYISRAGQQDGIGQALWELAQHALLTHSAAYARRQLTNVAAAVGWIARVSAVDSLGLLPPSTIQDDELLTGSHITGDNVWAAVGLRSAVDLARLAGESTLADGWHAIDLRFERALDAAIARASARTGHVPPGLDHAGGFDWGNYWVSYPLPILGPRSRPVQATIRWANAHSREGIATYADGALLHDYLGFPIYETELQSGDVPAALNGFYAEVVHTTAPGLGWEDGPTPYGGRKAELNLAPHGAFAGQVVTMLRNMLVRDDGTAVELLSGDSPAWMHPGDSISVRDAPTRFGTISFTLDMPRVGSGATLRWSRTSGFSAPLLWVLPYWIKRAQLPDGRVVGRSLRLRGASGSVTVVWHASLPSLSVAHATAQLNAGYGAHDEASPLVRAAGW
ncbi:MAG TPA: hypothetical protein VNV17_18130 [Solirubrobacteraceae bacterium]|jgi:hypothetical protein|nr:hypothetical protein [Solirubrobacteraceae bacterium]